jgi:hypothetical protein
MSTLQPAVEFARLPREATGFSEQLLELPANRDQLADPRIGAVEDLVGFDRSSPDRSGQSLRIADAGLRSLLVRPDDQDPFVQRCAPLSYQETDLIPGAPSLRPDGAVARRQPPMIVRLTGVVCRFVSRHRPGILYLFYG